MTTAGAPLRASVYLRRRARQLLPQALTMSLVTMLLIVVITPSNTFRETTAASIRSLETYTAVTPAQKPEFDSILVGLLEANPALQRFVDVKVAWFRYPMLIGVTVSPLVLMKQEEIAPLLDRAKLRLVAGRLPARNRTEVVLHEDVARAKGYELGSRASIQIDRYEVTRLFKVVGLVSGPARLNVGVIGAGLRSLFLNNRLADYMLVYARAEQKTVSDRYLHEVLDDGAPAFRVIDVAYVRERSEEALANLPVLVVLLTLATSAIVAMVVALLNVIVFQSRADEFAILLALGYRRKRLVGKLAAESIILAAGAWIVGATGGLAVLGAYDRYVLEPRGIIMQLLDVNPLILSMVLPLVAASASVVALWRRLATLDPVAIIERRFK